MEAAMNACSKTTGLMQQFQRLFGVLALFLFSFQVMATETPVVVSVDHRVTVTFSKPQLDTNKGEYTAHVRIRNRSAAPLLSPLRLTLEQFEGKEVKPLNAQGVGMDAQPYFELALPKGKLLAGGKTEPMKVIFAIDRNKDLVAAKELVTIAKRLPIFSYHVSAGVELAPLEPRAEPYALTVESGKVNVRFSVRLVRITKSSTSVYLRRVAGGKGIAMNDLGENGDLVANDGVYGVSILVDSTKMKPDTCLNYEAVISVGHSEVVSAPFNLCKSAFPVQAAISNTSNPVILNGGTKAVADEILIAAAAKTKSDAIRRLATDINAKVVGSIPPLNLYQLKLSTPATSARLLELIAQLNARAEVKAASVNAIGTYSSNDTYYGSQQGLQLVRAQDVWGAIATGSGVIVTVLDSGIDRTHPDFGTVGNCQLEENDCGGAITDTLGHGTEVAGIIAAKTNNALGVAGIAYGSKIHSIQVSPNAAVTDAEMAQGFANAAAYGLASVINASFGILNAFGNWAPVCTAINSAVLNGVTPVAVVINGAGNNNTNGAFYPARCNDSTLPANAGLTRKDLLITVANSASVTSAIDPICGAAAVDQRCIDSNYGAWVDIAAPGSAIWTTTLVSSGSYASPSGSSFSTPMVSGAAAILKSCGVPLDQIEPNLRTGTIPSIPIVTVPFPDGSSAPRLDVYRVLAHLNHTPTGVGLSNNSIYEKVDTSAGYVMGTLSATDVDTCDKFSFSVIPGGDAASFSINPATNTLILTAGVLNHVTKPSFAVTVRVTDFFGLTFDQLLTVNVLNVNDAPVGANSTVTTSENMAYAFSAANFGFTDPLDSPPNNLNAVIITTLPAAGQLKLGAVPVVAGQSVAAVSLGSLTFMPATNASGPAYASFTFQVVDDGGTANGGVNTDPTPNTLTINVTPVMTAPTGTPIVDPNPPTILNRKVPQVLSVDTSPIFNPDSWAVWGYQWRRSGADIGGATNSTYPLDYPDVGSFMSVCVKYSYDSGVTVATLCSNPDAIAVGDPHITTVDGLHYDFQSAGEFVALRGAGGMEIQVRQTPVSTANAITDGYSGLTSGVSINTAVAARVGTHRVSYQMKTNGNSASSGLELKVDGVVVTPMADGLDLGAGGRVVSAPGGGIQIDFPEQTTLVVTPYWWGWNNVWYLDVTVLHTSATEGIMGARYKGSWLPRLANGSVLGAMPAAMHDRYVDMYVKFADSWRVNNDTSLFDYAPDTSTKTFTFKEWPKENPPYVIGNGPVAKPVKRQIAQQLCRGVVGKNDNADCMFDVMVTGNRGIAKAHLFTQQIRAGLTSIIVSDDRGLSRDQEMVTFTATVARQSAPTQMELDRNGVPTGTVQFTLNGNGVEKPVKLDAKGQAQLKLPRLKIEKQTIGARYIPAKGSIFVPSSSFESARVIVEGKR
jgi:subtilisin family serine protease